mgnify:CR=1 FL=1
MKVARGCRQRIERSHQDQSVERSLRRQRRGKALGDLWRNRQFAYTWLRTAAGAVRAMIQRLDGSVLN